MDISRDLIIHHFNGDLYGASQCLAGQQPLGRCPVQMATTHCILLHITFFKKSIRNTIRMSSSLDPDQARRSVGPDLGANYLPRLSADDTGRQRVNGHLVASSVADSQANFHDNQGSATVVIHVKRGELVWTSNCCNGNVIFGDSYRSCAFSGVLLYSDVL